MITRENITMINQDSILIIMLFLGILMVIEIILICVLYATIRKKQHAEATNLSNMFEISKGFDNALMNLNSDSSINFKQVLDKLLELEARQISMKDTCDMLSIALENHDAKVNNLIVGRNNQSKTLQATDKPRKPRY